MKHIKSRFMEYSLLGTKWNRKGTYPKKSNAVIREQFENHCPTLLWTFKIGSGDHYSKPYLHVKEVD
jgi:hypothetical protein